MKGFLIVLVAVLCGCGSSEQANNPAPKTPTKTAASTKPQPIPTKTTKPVPQPIPSKSTPKTPQTAPKPVPTKPSPKTTKTIPPLPPIKPNPKPTPKTTKTKPKKGPTKPSDKDGKTKPSPNKGQPKQTLQHRWALLVGAANQGLWPNYQVIQKNLGQPNQQKQNVTMNTKAILSPKEKGAASPAARAFPAVSPCIRWDYFDTPKGQESIQLYFFNGSLAGFHWVKNTKKNQGNKTGGKKPGNKTAGNKAAGKNKPSVGAKQPQQMLQQRWALLVGAASQGQWPNYQVIQQNLGQPNQQKQNVTMNTKAILNSKDKGAVNPVARSIPTVSPCIRWDYFGSSKGQESIQLYFFDGSLAGFQWVKNTKKNQGNKTGGKKPGNKNRGKGKAGKAGPKPR